MSSINLNIQTQAAGQDKRAQVVSAIATALLTIAVIVVLMLTHLSLSKIDVSTEDKGEIELEEFIEVMNMPSAPAMKSNESSRAKADTQEESQPTPVSGTDLKDVGKAAEAPPVVTQKEESPMQVPKKEEPKPTGPSEDEKKKAEEEAIQRQANNEIANAFNKSSGKHNNSAGTSDKGNNGTTTGNAPQGTLAGQGMGKAGGGWSLPAYAAVQSPVTGSVKMVVTIDKEGNVTNLRFDGGDAPAATNSSVRQACAAEVRKRKFTRANYDNAPETSTAYIIYTFK